MIVFHKAHPLKRLAAYIIDLILLCAITVGVIAVMASAMNYKVYRDELTLCYEEYGQKYQVDLGAPIEDLSKEDQEKYNNALDEMNEDPRALAALSGVARIMLISSAVGFLLGYIILEVVLPLIFKNGQTIGKKAMGLCVMHKEHVQVGVMQIIYRAIVGKYFVETLIPVAMLLLKLSGTLGTTASLILAAIAMTQGFIVLMSQANCGIHDKLFKTVVADFNKQEIFDSLEERIAYEEAYEKEIEARRAAYAD